MCHRRDFIVSGKGQMYIIILLDIINIFTYILFSLWDWLFVCHHKMCAWSALLGGFGGLEKGQNDDEL